MKSRLAKPVRIPNISSRKTQTQSISFSGGINTMKPNDELAMNELALAQDARMIRLGEYQTRKGFNLLTDAIGKAVAVDEMGADDREFNIGSGLRVKFSIPSEDAGFRLWQVDLMLAKGDGTFGSLLCDIYDDVNDTPERKLATTSFDSGLMSDEISQQSAKFVEAPDLLPGQSYWLVLRQQERAGTGSFTVGTHEGGLIYVSEGEDFWETFDYTPNMRLYSADATPIDSVFVTKVGSDILNWFMCGGKLYRADMTGNVTLQNGNLPAGTRKAYFNQSLDPDTENAALRYAYGTGKPNKIQLSDFSETTLNNATSNARNLLLHGQGKDGYFFYLSSDDFNGVFTSESVSNHPDDFGIVDDEGNHERVFVGSIPSPKCGDDLTAMASLAGTLVFSTRKHKYTMLGDSWQTFQIGDAPAIGGTFSQESVAVDDNYVYYATDTGIMKFNGSSEVDLTGADKDPRIQNTYRDILYKDSIVLGIWEDRLYVFYTDRPDGINNRCLVYNLNLNIWESFDSNTYVSCVYARDNQAGVFLCGHSRVGALMTYEDTSNDWSDMGAPIKFQLSEPDRPYGASAQIKRISKWRPEFEKVTGKYGVECGYSFDFDDNPRYAFTVDLSTGGIRWDNGYLWDNGELWGGDGGLGTKLTTRTAVYGEWRRCALHYRHWAAREPVTILGHTLTLQTQRIR
jgi:hypothetical protein